ncbi:ATP-binding cassette domain-containing protein [Paenibacillus sp. LMG 31456]|uniref:ATP-binding cassette domain-containing protein n=1 Tax=Paenibacillus foliorum TaxID=2654974 RepID=A0A972H193_9BACL|nr:ATP-binding cassette domain-containing protein [Paenibacillus foliorum]NOU97983.1 ATP-binding cassette domain-containing protein [Paenibacillus foliorum]
MIQVNHLTKSFRIPITGKNRWQRIKSYVSGAHQEKTAVQDISFTVNKGEFVGYIGPNGAGKSTTIKMLTGILHPSAGEVLIDGSSPHKNRRQVVRKLGVVFGQRCQLWWDLPVRDSYDILAEMYRIERSQKERTLAELGELLQLGEFMDTPVRKLSLGQRMRADLAASLLHNPDILFLDEPTIGLDIVAKKTIRGLLKSLNRELGKTILLTTHDMDDIEQLCERVMVINHGQLAYDGTIDGLRERIGLPTLIKVSYTGPVSVPAEWSGDFLITEHLGNDLIIQCNRRSIQAMEILRQMEQWGTIADVHMEEPNFEEVIHRIY